MFSVMTRELLSIIEHGLAGFACQQPENIPPKSGNRPKSSLIDSKFGTEVEEDVKKIFLEDQAQKIKGTLRI